MFFLRASILRLFGCVSAVARGVMIINVLKKGYSLLYKLWFGCLNKDFYVLYTFHVIKAKLTAYTLTFTTVYSHKIER
ncbi:hypothetical protein Hanom_Chr08g00740491 [Helianthus anomalus]